MTSLPLPVKLPCLVRAIYSWSGEEKSMFEQQQIVKNIYIDRN